MRLLPFVAASLLAPSALVAQSNAADAARTITAADFMRRIGVIAHDSMGGRDTPSPGLERTAAWIAAEFGRFGLRPGGDGGTFVQRYPIRRLRLDTAQSSLRAGGAAPLTFGADVLRLGGGWAEGVDAPVTVLRGAAGADAEALAALPLEGAVVFVPLAANQQGGLDRAAFRLLAAVARGRPAAVIGVTELGDVFWNRIRQQQAGASPVAPWQERGGPPLLVMRPATAAALLRRGGADPALLDPAAGSAPTLATARNLRLGVAVRAAVVEEFQAPNVVGILPGRDPALRNEYVVYSAHMDHVGIGRPVNGDSIYNGADDDASGTTAVIEVAEAFARLSPAPRRSVIFLLVSGEEKGLWGSDYFAAHPPVPIGQIVANLNADMVGRNWSDTIVAIGLEHSDLGATLRRVNARHPDLGMTAIDDPWPEERFYFRSDHYHFARRGVPILFFFNGVHADYHRPSDHVDKIDGDKAARIARLLFHLGLEVANADARPRWNPASYEAIVTER